MSRHQCTKELYMVYVTTLSLQYSTLQVFEKATAAAKQPLAYQADFSGLREAPAIIKAIKINIQAKYAISGWP